MNDREKMTAEQLGMALGTAQHRLRRMVTFDHICRLDLNECYHCKEPMCVDTHTFGHKVPWFTFEDIGKAYFDPDNVAISHKFCNMSVFRTSLVVGDGSTVGKLAEKLGLDYNTANKRRTKLIRFGLIQRLGLDICYRCSEPITDISTLSVEHTVDWWNHENVKEIFFTLGGISFSHRGCNSAAGKKPGRHPCPSLGCAMRGCLVPECIEVMRHYKRDYRDSNKKAIRAQGAEYYQKNKEYRKAYQIGYREKNRDSINAKQRQRRKDNRG